MKKFKNKQDLKDKLNADPDLTEEAKQAALDFYELMRRKPHKTESNSHLEGMTYRSIAESFISRYAKEVCPVSEACLFGSSLDLLDKPFDFQHDIDIFVIRSPEHRSIHYSPRKHKTIYESFGDVIDCIEDKLDFEIIQSMRLI